MVQSVFELDIGYTARKSKGQNSCKASKTLNYLNKITILNSLDSLFQKYNRLVCNISRQITSKIL